MRICIPIEFKPEGGGQYFLQQFRAFLETHGHAWTPRLADRYEVLFTNHWVLPVGGILRGIRSNPQVRVVQRIDGSATDYGRAGEADQRQHEVNRLADLTIFQSDYCRWSTREKFPVIVQDGPVIHNPVDLEHFNPGGARMPWPDGSRVVSASWSTNPKKGAASIYAVARQNPQVDFYLCGRFVDVPQLPNLHGLGVLDRQNLATALRSAHALLTFSENEACPNHVLEALASGLPVLYLDSGAMKEVVGEGGLPVTVDTFAAQFERIAAGRQAWSERSRQRAVTAFSPPNIFAKYIAAIDGACAASPRVAPRKRFLLALGGPATAWWLGQDRWNADSRH